MRLVHLLRGQAYFRIAKQRERPFIVESHGRAVIATGTVFDVEALAHGLHVVLVEGHVDVRTGVTVDAPLLARLEPGDSLKTESGASPHLDRGTNLLSVLAWRSGRLVFDDEPLAEAIARMSRYSPQRVILEGPVASLRVSGVFKARDVAGLVAALKREYSVEARYDADGTLRLKTHD
jgi:transmembrane sensor